MTTRPLMPVLVSPAPDTHPGRRAGNAVAVAAVLLALTIPTVTGGTQPACPQGRYWAAPTQSCEPIATF